MAELKPALFNALCEMVYETTHLSPMEPDGSHWCKISPAALAKAREAITAWNTRVIPGEGR